MPVAPPIRFPLTVSPENRDSTTVRDAKMINGFIEPVGEGIVHVYKRPGTSVNITYPYTATAGLGIFNWLGDIYSIQSEFLDGISFPTHLYKNGVIVTVGAGSNNLNRGATYTFSNSLGATPRLFMQNGIHAYYYDPASTGTFNEVLTSTTISTTGTLVGGSAQITVSSTTGMYVNASVTSTSGGVPANSYIISVDDSTHFTINQPCTIPSLKFSGHLQPTASGATHNITSITPSTSSIVLTASIIRLDANGNIVPGWPANTTVTTIVSGTEVDLTFRPDATVYEVNPFYFRIDNPSLSGDALTIVNPGMPADGFVKGSAYLDGTTYVLTPTSYVDGSGFNDLTTFPPLNSIAAMIEPDAGVFMSKQLSYVLAMKKYSVEVFYDAAAPVGSPLGSAAGMKLNVGCRHGDSVQSAEGALFWIGETKDGSVMAMMMESMRASIISTPAVDRLLQGGNYSTVYSWTARISGHRFYGVTLVSSNITLVYDVTTKHWAQWQDPNGNYFPFLSSTTNSSQVPLLQHESGQYIYALDSAVYTDNSVIFTVDIYTPNWDGGSRKIKYLKLMDFVGDQTEGSSIAIRVSDDDYQTWSNPRVVDLSKKRPYLTDCGSFRRRALHISHKANTPLRIQSIELQVMLGTL